MCDCALPNLLASAVTPCNAAMLGAACLKARSAGSRWVHAAAGVLLRKLLGDTALEGTTHVIIDEVRATNVRPGRCRAHSHFLSILLLSPLEGARFKGPNMLAEAAGMPAPPTFLS